MASWSGGPEPGPRLADLEKLAAELGSERYAVTLVRMAGRRPHLHITNRTATQLTENIYTADGWYWFGWAERVAPVSDIARAAEKITHVLRALDTT